MKKIISRTLRTVFGDNAVDAFLGRAGAPLVGDMVGYERYRVNAERMVFRRGINTVYIPEYKDTKKFRDDNKGTYAVDAISNCAAVIDGSGKMYLFALSVPAPDGTPIPVQDLLEHHGFKSANGKWVNPVARGDIPVNRFVNFKITTPDIKLHNRVQALLGQEPLPEAELARISKLSDRPRGPDQYKV